MINKAIENIEKISRDFSGIFEAASNFVVHANSKLEEINISVPKCFSTIRSSRSAPEGITNQKRNFEVSYHNAATDAVLSSMQARFSSHEKLYKQISCFAPNRFSEFLASPQNLELSLIANAVPEIDSVAIQKELIVTLCQYFVGFYFMYTVVSNLSSVIVIHYLLNVSACCQINLLALNSLRLPSFELSWCWFLVKISF